MSFPIICFIMGILAHMVVSRVGGDRRDMPLHIACRKGNVKTVKSLLDCGADPNVLNCWKQTPLQLACSSDSPVIVKMLIDRGADGNDAVALAKNTPGALTVWRPPQK